TPPKGESIPLHPLKARTIKSGGTELTIVSFDRRNHRLVVADQSGGPGSDYDDANDAGRGHLAAINGGFFTPTGSPLGLVVTNGTRRGGINRASFLGTGFFLGPQAELMSRTEYLSSSPSRQEVLQSGPRLVWSGETLTGLSDREKRPRSFLLWNGKEHFALGYAESASLKGLSSLLQRQPISGFKIAYALNLDGGRSCDFWISSSVSGGGFTRSSFLKKDVRNYLVLQRKP
ncbi:phosphodiester glycosidase family protein, partial [Akkermansiaceae bacterium]|nr:phosphodiester glycosidase family protein [Akkermansiaceae bacterium]